MDVPKETGESSIFRRDVVKDGELLKLYDESITTVYEVFQDAVKTYGMLLHDLKEAYLR